MNNRKTENSQEVRPIRYKKDEPSPELYDEDDYENDYGVIYEEGHQEEEKKALAPKTLKDVELATIEDNPGYYLHILNETVVFDGVAFREIRFDFEAMNGRDLLQVEDEMARKNKISVGVELSKVNQYLLAVRAANQAREENGFIVTSDLLEQLPMADFNDICNATRRFFTQ